MNIDRLKKIEKMFEKGLNGPQIGKRLGITKQAVQYYKKKYIVKRMRKK